MPKREYLHEWMHRFEIVRDVSIMRVWTHRTETARPEESAEFHDQHADIWRRFSHAGTVEAVSELPYVNAVEVLDASGNGRLVYVDWP